MKRFGKVALSALMFAGATAFFVAPASAGVGISFGFGGPGYVTFSDPCDYYDYYDGPPPWGLPADYCDYPVYFEPVYYDGIWYRGPIYYRWYGGQRLFWLNGNWRRDEWRGGLPDIRWEDRGGWGHRDGGIRGAYGRDRSYDSGSGRWSGGGHNWQDAGHNNWPGGGNNWSGGGHGNWSGGSHGWSGGGGGHGWSGGGGHSGGGHGGHGGEGGRGSGGHHH
jgi:hypothetical protein